MKKKINPEHHLGLKATSSYLQMYNLQISQILDKDRRSSAFLRAVT